MNGIRHVVALGLAATFLFWGASASARVLRGGDNLRQGEGIYSDEGRYYAVLQHDGNFVVYRNASPGRAVWSTNTTGLGAVSANMQHDGNFVLYDRAGRAIWNTGTHGPTRSFTVNDIGQAVVMVPGQGHWSSAGAMLPLYRRLGVKATWVSPYDTSPGKGGPPIHCYMTWQACQAIINGTPTYGR